MPEYNLAAYVEGNALGGGWWYRINRIIKANKDIAYEVVLTHDNPTDHGHKLQLWIAEFVTLDQARAATGRVLQDWSQHPHYMLAL